MNLQKFLPTNVIFAHKFTSSGEIATQWHPGQRIPVRFQFGIQFGVRVSVLRSVLRARASDQIKAPAVRVWSERVDVLADVFPVGHARVYNTDFAHVHCVPCVPRRGHEDCG
jgi:hypothetical protein